MNFKDYLAEELKKLNSSHELNWIIEDIEKNHSLNKLPRAKEIILKKQSNEPLAYILGNWPLLEYDFYVGPGALIPRPETEELVEKAVDLFLKNLKLQNKTTIHVVDFGSGTGCIGISFAKLVVEKNPELKIELTLIEKSTDAFKYLKQNIKTHAHPKINYTALNCSWYDLSDLKLIDVALSNPPYITNSEFESLDQSVSDFEPISALVYSKHKDKASHSALAYFEILEILKSKLNPQGFIGLELNPSTAIEVLKFAVKSGFGKSKIDLDIADKDRFLFFEGV